VARAVLFANFGRLDNALDQLNDAQALRPGDSLPIYAAWLRLRNPNDGQLSVGDAESIIRDLAPVFETPPDGAPAYYVRALAETAAGRWEDARRDVRQIVKFATPKPPTLSAELALWLMHADGATTRYLHACLDILWQLPTPVDLRIALANEVVRRAGDVEICRQEGIQAKEAAAIRGWVHFRLAKFHAEKSDRDSVYRHAKAALVERVDDLNAGTCRADDLLRDYNTDPDFQKLYTEYPPPAG